MFRRTYERAQTQRDGHSTHDIEFDRQCSKSKEKTIPSILDLLVVASLLLTAIWGPAMSSALHALRAVNRQ